MKIWNDVKQDFEYDGSLRDIYVLGINDGDWDRFIDAVINSSHKLKFKHGDEVKNLPGSFNGIKKLQQSEPTVLSIYLENSILLNCHFFIEEQIELDLTPSDFVNEQDFLHLVNFLSWINVALGHKVLLTHENSPELEILSIGQRYV